MDSDFVSKNVKSLFYVVLLTLNIVLYLTFFAVTEIDVTFSQPGGQRLLEFL